MSKASEIVDFVRLTRGLSDDTLAKAIRLRWPDVDESELREALTAAAVSTRPASDDGLAPSK